MDESTCCPFPTESPLHSAALRDFSCLVRPSAPLRRLQPGAAFQPRVTHLCLRRWPFSHPIRTGVPEERKLKSHASTPTFRKSCWRRRRWALRRLSKLPLKKLWYYFYLYFLFHSSLCKTMKHLVEIIVKSRHMDLFDAIARFNFAYVLYTITSLHSALLFFSP